MFNRRSNTDLAIKVHGTKPTVFEADEYKMLTHSHAMTAEDKLSCRGKARETILVDMQSPALKKYFDAFLASFGALSVDEDALTQPVDECIIEDTVIPSPYDLNVLQELVMKVRVEMRGTSEADIVTLIQQNNQKHHYPETQRVAPLEWFWEGSRGYCRHHVLASAYLLVNLIDRYAKQEGHFDDALCRVYRFRTQLYGLENPSLVVSHAVLIYEAKNGHRYLLDPSKPGFSSESGVAMDLSNLSDADKVQLQKSYHPYNVDLFIQTIHNTYDPIRQKYYKKFSSVYHYSGTLYYHNEKMTEAIRAFQDAILQREQIQDKNNSDYRFLVGCYDNICQMHFQQHRLSEAIDALNRAVDCARQITDQGYRSELLTNCHLSLELLKLAREAKSWGFVCISMPRDGNCFFHTVINQLELHQVSQHADLTAADLRKLAVDHIAQHFDRYKDFILEEERPHFLEKNAENGEWPDNNLVAALSRALNVTMVVINNDGSNPIIHKRPEPLATLYLGYEVDRHYQSLRKEANCLPPKNIQARIDEEVADDFQEARSLRLGF